MILALLLLLPIARSAIVDYGPPQDILGQWKFDLYDASGNERGTSATPFYVLSPGIPAALGQKAAAASTSVVIATEQANALSTAGNQASEISNLQQIVANTGTSGIQSLQSTTNSVLSTIQFVLTQILGEVSSPNDSTRNTYSGVSATFTFPNSPTDIFTISGSASKIVRVIRIAFTATQTTGAQRDVFLIKRSTAGSGGTSTAVPLTAHDSTMSAATGSARVYTANPTVGTTVAIVRARKVYIGSTSQNSDELILDFGSNNSQPLVLRGAAETLAINLNGVTSAGGQADISVTTTEDSQ